MGRGTCATCGGPTGRSNLAVYCLPCAKERGNAQQRAAHMASRKPRPCDDCQADLPIGSRAIFCAACRARRELEYRRTEKYKAHRDRYRLSEKGLRKEQERLERTKEKRLAQMRAYHHAHKSPSPIVQCATLLCGNRFVRGARQGARKFCSDCMRVFYGPAYARRRVA